MKYSAVAALLAGLVGLVDAGPAGTRFKPRTMPKRRLDTAESDVVKRTTTTVTYPEGAVTGLSLLGIESFRGIPFAQPPTGNLRLRPPVRYNETVRVGSVDGTGIGPSCPQMFFSTASDGPLASILGNALNLPLLQTVTGATEDCLTINVQRPAGTTANSSLPVLFWIFGGGFELGSTAMYDGSDLVAEGIEIGQPFVFVAVNYRTGGFGFLGGKEIAADGAANLGLLDQRVGLQWVADNIAAFGGDPDKVTVWGESAGAISVYDQMVMYDGDHTYKGKPLFRGAIMSSGSIVPAEAVDSAKAQKVYDAVVKAGGCAGSRDTLNCLRALDYDAFLDAANSVPGLLLTYTGLALSYLPRPDGTVLTASPDVLTATNRRAKVPFIIGDQEDEGTLFALATNNITSTSKIVTYLSTLFFQQADPAMLKGLVETYSTSVTAGSPFRTGIFNELYPGFKRLAAILGDMTFNMPRRILLAESAKQNPDVPTWSYLGSYDYGFPFLGTFHGSDLLQVFYGILPNHASETIQKYHINFVTNGDPNKGAPVDMQWPRWSAGQKMLQFFADSTTVLADTYRAASFQYLYDNVATLLV